jgi:hypothetical protein
VSGCTDDLVAFSLSLNHMCSLVFVRLYMYLMCVVLISVYFSKERHTLSSLGKVCL